MAEFLFLSSVFLISIWLSDYLPCPSKETDDDDA